MKALSPFDDIYEYEINENEEISKINEFVDNSRMNIVIQGIGFVGAAMIAALCNVKKNEVLLYNVIGVDLSDSKNYWKIGRVNSGKSPVVSSDRTMCEAYFNGKKNKNILATYSSYAYTKADIVIIDINLDIHKKEIGNPYDYSFSYDNFISSITNIAKHIHEETLVIVESTVPPGTTEKILYPIFQKAFLKRNLDINKLYLAHSYERVMPGKDYLKSITDAYRVYSAITKKGKQKVRDFLSSFINVAEYSLSELHSTTASEMAKVLENSYRAVNIAFIQEWTKFAETANVDLFEVIAAIKKRPTHQNIMLPGFGVGGYCLTKDSLLADWSQKNLFGENEDLAMSLTAIKVNDLMPIYSFNLIKKRYPNLIGHKIGICGISYLNDVADTRHSPSELFYDLCIKEKAEIYLHDAYVTYWEEKQILIDTILEKEKTADIEIGIFTVRHQLYLDLTVQQIMDLMPNIKFIVDANNIFSDGQAKEFVKNKINIVGVGKGNWNHLLEKK
jgi:nucleotide sugar dehydrogenase